MEEQDYSKSIYDTYFNPQGKVIKIILKDNSVLEGIFVGVFHGDTEAGESFVMRWHIISEKDISAYHKNVIEEPHEYEMIIEQENIKHVTFK